MIELDVEGKTPSYLELAKLKFMLKLPEFQKDEELQNKLLAGIIEGDMAPYYSIVCEDLNWDMDIDLLTKMQTANKNKLMEFDSEIDSDKVEQDIEPKLWLEKLTFLCSIGDKEPALKLATMKSHNSSLSTNCRLDAIFAKYRIFYFHDCDINGMKSTIEKATELIEGRTGPGGDWSARNKLKVYEALCSLGLRNYTRAANLLLDVVPTFESYELVDFSTVIWYTIISCMIAFTRCELNKRVEENSTLMQALNANYKELLNFYKSLKLGRYHEFFKYLAKFENRMKHDFLLHSHYRHYVREMRLKAYCQLLQAYRSLSLKRMAQAFGVTENYIENEVARFAALGRLQCKIDGVAGTIVTNSYLSEDKSDLTLPETTPEATFGREILYQNVIKRGDNLLNRLNKLARVVDF